MIILEPLTFNHAFDLYPRRRGDVEAWSLDFFLHSVEYILSKGYSYAITDGSKTLCICSIVSEEEGVGIFLLVGSNDMIPHIREITRLFRSKVLPTMKELGIHRLQADVLAEKPTWVKWAKLFGFKEEGIMRKYTTDQKDCVLMARVI